MQALNRSIVTIRPSEVKHCIIVLEEVDFIHAIEWLHTKFFDDVSNFLVIAGLNSRETYRCFLDNLDLSPL